MQQAILRQIGQLLPALSDRQQMVANFILSNCENASYMTSRELAEASNVSEATVIRFANRLGFARYADMQAQLREVVRGKLFQIERFRRSTAGKQPGTMVQDAIHSMQTDIRSIEITMSNLREEELSEIVISLATARRIYISGSHSEYGLACYFASTLSWIRDQVYLLDETHSPSFDAAADMQPEDVVFVLSFPPYPAATVRYATSALSHGSKVIALTDGMASPLARRADYCLIAHDEKLSYADNPAPTVSLLAMLLAQVSRYDSEASSDYLRRRQQYWEEIGFYHQETD